MLSGYFCGKRLFSSKGLLRGNVVEFLPMEMQNAKKYCMFIEV